jgi:hypothetical protein
MPFFPVPLVPDSVIWADTASGSRYRIDPFAGRWYREAHDPRSSDVRTGDGVLIGLYEMPRVGAALSIIGPSLTPGGDYRHIATSPVVRVWTSEPDAPPVPVPDFWPA